MKFTSYEQFRNATDEDLSNIDPEDYTDEENAKISIWFMKLEQELIPSEKLLNLTEEDIWWYHLDNKHLLNDVISEAPSSFKVGEKIILGREIITYPEFSIIKEDGKNNFYRIMK